MFLVAPGLGFRHGLSISAIIGEVITGVIEHNFKKSLYRHFVDLAGIEAISAITVTVNNEN